ncbi:predicted protein [Nematostella vectensis]|uniref:Polyamine-modulated factor 1 n=1 Tax=Nematostella vectensis TaxID=45351 RepID=A7RSE0_NEMVE|nr:polyamine-modulated factor 1 [Nematostella vectensis]EDO45619.1 predicted protein [Nematostella vectensis]|eukprot:XP_001637682.1 predicted protein [Nematostella vectensis]
MASNTESLEPTSITATDTTMESTQGTTRNESLLEDFNLESLEGKRITAFCQAFKKTLDRVLAPGKPEKFNNVYRAVRAQNPEAFSSITEQMMQNARENIETEFKLMIKQEDLVDLFGELDKIRESQMTDTDQDQKEAWRPSGIPSVDCQDHIMHIKLAYKDQLQKMLQQIEQENEQLKETVLPKREKIISKEQELIKNKKLEMVVQTCQNVDVKKLQQQGVLLKTM